MRQYQEILRDIITDGTLVETRGTKSLALFGRNLCVDLRHGFPAITLRNVHPQSAINELLWDIQSLGHIGSLPSAGLQKAWSHYDNGYGYVANSYSRAWRQWPASEATSDDKVLGAVSYKQVDQLKATCQALKVDPCARTHVVQSFNPTMLEGLKQCASSLCFSSLDGVYLNLNVFNRSLDAVIGCAGDLVRYATLLTLMARCTNLKPAKLNFACTNVHIYEANFGDAERLIESTHQYSPSKLAFLDTTLGYECITDFQRGDVSIQGYCFDKAFKLNGELTVGDLSYIKRGENNEKRFTYNG